MTEKTFAELQEEVKALEGQLKAKEAEASAAHQRELLAKPLFERLTFAAYARCKGCHAGLAYDPAMFPRVKHWDCSAVILGLADSEEKEGDGSYKHAAYPFAFYEIKSENQPSANGATTRPKSVETLIAEADENRPRDANA